MTPPLITSCICTREGDEAILDALYSLVGQTAAPGTHEVLVLAIGPGDFATQRGALRRLIEQGHGVGFLHEADSRWTAAWRHALAASRASHLHFIDADTIANPRLIECLLQEIEGSASELVVGHVLPRFTELPPHELDYDYWALWGLRHYGNQPRTLARDEIARANNFCVARGAIEKGLLERLPGGELMVDESVHGPRVSPGAFAFKRVAVARYATADVLDRIEEGGTSGCRAESRFAIASAVGEELARAARRSWFQLRLALEGRRT